MRKINPKIRLKAGGALAAAGICLLCGVFSADLWTEPEANRPDPLGAVAGAERAVRIDAGEAAQFYSALASGQYPQQELEILAEILEQ